MTHVTLIWLRLVFWFVFVGLIGRGSAQQIDQSPRLEDLIEFLNVDPSDFDAISQAVVAFPVRFTVDVSDRGALSTMLQRGGADLTRGCALVIPTYFIHVTDAAIAIVFRATSRDNVTTFSIKPGSLPLSPQSADPLPPLRDPATGKKFKRMWMHVEKTGGSFATTAEMLGYQWIAHNPPPIGGCETAREKCRIITLLREPTQRTSSWFYYSKHSEHCLRSSNHDHGKLMSCFEQHMTQLYYGPNTSATWWGCQAKMVLGYHCQTANNDLPAYLRQSSTSLAEHAIATLRQDYDFIGVTDDFDASVSLAHQVLQAQGTEARRSNDRTSYSQLDFHSGFIKMNTREQVGQFSSAGAPGSESPLAMASPTYKYSECVESRRCQNTPDELLFREAQRLMLRSIMIHHDTPVRCVDSSRFADILHIPKATHDMGPNRQYQQNLTRVLETSFAMSNEQCTNIAAARSSARSLYASE